MQERERLLLGKYYDLNEKKKLVTVSYVFDKASDIVDNTLDNKEYLIKPEIMERINESIKMIPVLYKVDFKLRVLDFEDFDKDQIIESFNDAFEMNYYSLEHESRKKWVTTTILVIIGILILFINAYAKLNGWYNTFSSMAQSVTSEVFDITAWVFIWEAVTVMFLTPSDLPFNSNRIRFRVRQVYFLDKDSYEVGVVSFGEDKLQWESISRLDRITRRGMLICGAAFIALGTIGFVENIQTAVEAFSSIPEIAGTIGTTAQTTLTTTAQAAADISAQDETQIEALTLIILVCIMVVFEFVQNLLEIFVGIGALSKYTGRGPFQKSFRPLIIILFILLVINTALTIAAFGKNIRARYIILYIMYLVFFLSTFIQHFIVKNKEKLIAIHEAEREKRRKAIEKREQKLEEKKALMEAKKASRNAKKSSDKSKKASNKDKKEE